MTGAALPWPLAGLAALGLLLSLGAFIGLRALAHEQRVSARLMAVIAEGRGRPQTVPQLIAPAPIARLDRLLSALASLWGMDRRRITTYPLPWWLVILVTFAAARIPLGLIGTLVGDWIVWLTPLLWLLLARWTFARFDDRRRHKLYEQLPDALAAVSRGLKVGLPVVEALRGAARTMPEPTGQEFREVVDRLALGMTLPEAIDEAARRSGLIEYCFLAAAVSLQAQTGGGLAETLDNLADVVRRRLALRKRAIALTGEARASAWVLGALPFVTFGALLLTSPDYARMLLTDRSGQQVLAAAMLLLLLGVFSMRLLIRRSLA